uniref:Uncharacterized protein n=1 Tax=Arundo donax TaxID=35708 RepID=A0A0A8Z0C0_ARUDO
MGIIFLFSGVNRILSQSIAQGGAQYTHKMLRQNKFKRNYLCCNLPKENK